MESCFHSFSGKLLLRTRIFLFQRQKFLLPRHPGSLLPSETKPRMTAGCSSKQFAWEYRYSAENLSEPVLSEQ